MPPQEDVGMVRNEVHGKGCWRGYRHFLTGAGLAAPLGSDATPSGHDPLLFRLVTVDNNSLI